MTESRRDAEREAIERRLRGEAVRVDENNPDIYFVPLPLALDAIAALDAARSPQGVNIPPLCDRCGGDHYITEHDEATRLRSPQDEDYEAGEYVCPNGHRILAEKTILCDECPALTVYVPLSRLIAEREHRLQGEDHEAGIKAMAAVICPGGEDKGSVLDQARRAHAAYLSRCPSPERDTVRQIVDAMRASCLNCVSTSGADWVEETFLAGVPERDTERLVEALRRLVELKDDPNHDSIDPVIKGAAWREAREALAEFGGSDAKPPDSRVSQGE